MCEGTHRLSSEGVPFFQTPHLDKLSPHGVARIRVADPGNAFHRYHNEMATWVDVAWSGMRRPSFLAAPVPDPVPTYAERPLSAPLPTYEVHRADGPITIDGHLDEAAWKKAGCHHALRQSSHGMNRLGAKQKTTARLLWDDTFLYASYACEDTDIVANYRHRDDPTYKDHTVELFINPDPSRKNYIGLEINAAAVLADYVVIDPHVLLLRLRSEVGVPGHAPCIARAP